MKKCILLIFLTSLTASSFCQSLKSTTWKIDQIIGVDTNNIQEFTLKKVDTTNQFWSWGNIVKFSSDSTFTCEYSARCGNDCFPSSNGLYNTIDSSKVTIILKEFKQEGDCQHLYLTPNRILGDYIIKKQDSVTIKLVKQLITHR